MRDAGYWIRHLELVPHPEGGYFRELYRSPRTIPCASPEDLPGRPFVTSIYYLLRQGDFSAFHRLRGVELWHFLDGGTVRLHRITKAGTYGETRLGCRVDLGEVPQCVVEEGTWFAAAPDDSASYCLVGCTVVPGFDFRDFELGRKEYLLREFPRHTQLIERYALP